jgi:hypothetical protein
MMLDFNNPGLTLEIHHENPAESKADKTPIVPLKVEYLSLQMSEAFEDFRSHHRPAETAFVAENKQSLCVVDQNCQMTGPQSIQALLRGLSLIIH